MKEQWAGLFQQLLAKQSKWNEQSVLDEMKKTSKSLRELVDYVMEERNNSSEAFQQVIFANHPLFSDLAKKTSAQYRLYFINFEEMHAWLNARSWARIEEEFPHDDKFIYVRKSTHRNTNYEHTLLISKNIFNEEDGSLLTFNNRQWNNNFVELEVKEEVIHSSTVDDLDDDIPF